MNKRIKVKCKHCGKPFCLMGLPVVSVKYINGRLRLERKKLNENKTYSVTYDGIVCSYKCNRYARQAGLNVLNYPKSVSMTEARRVGL